MFGTSSAKDRFARYALSMDFLAMSMDRIAQASETAVERNNAENVAAVLRALGTAMDAARAGHPNPLEVFALDAADVSGSCAFLEAMEANLTAFGPLCVGGDEPEGE